MGSSDLADYYQEVFNFTASMSLKFTPLADAMNQVVIKRGYDVDDTAPTTWKYYLNLTGQYHVSDTQMYVISLDTQQSILFSPETLAVNPKTALAYVPGQSIYASLCARYPDQTDLIKSIVYPASDINSTILAEDFTILAYGPNFLESSEYDIILQTITEFLCYINKRWYFNFFSYEPYYTWTFWGLLWQQIIEITLLARILAIKTSSVHSWHIWQYLASYGLGDYSDVLSRTQSMFLYRNMPYIIANRGKQTNLVVLADHLLSDLGVGLYGLDIWQETIDNDLCQLTPQLVPIGIPTKYINALPAESAESVSVMSQRLYALGTEVDISAGNLTEITAKIATTPLNTMPTKLLELRAIATDLKFAEFLNHFLLDSLIYAVANNLYNTTVSVTEPTTLTTLAMSETDALIFYSYCAFMSMGQTPVNIPNKYMISVAFNKAPTLPTTMVFGGYTYPMSYFLNTSTYLGNYAWPSSPALSPVEFTRTLSVQFLAALNQIQNMRMSEDTRANRAMRLLSEAVMVKEQVSLDLTSSTTYAQWFATQPEALRSMLTTLNDSANPISAYNELSDIILSQLMPATPTFSLYGNFALTNTTYKKFKQLFVQLCSYNILFLDSDTIVETGIFLGKMTSYADSQTISREVEIPMPAPMRINHIYENTFVMAQADVNLRIESTLSNPQRIHGGIDVTRPYVYGGRHRMGLGLRMGSNAVTQSEKIYFDMGKNNSYFLSPA